jgi:hypothetical protein
MIGFTKGKWEAERNKFAVFIYCERGYLIAQIVDRPEAEHNKSLIAAAPDMYEALEDVLNEYSDLMSDMYGNHDGSTTAYMKAEAALAKARGEI